jgi:hypothetical protein
MESRRIGPQQGESTTGRNGFDLVREYRATRKTYYFIELRRGAQPAILAIIKAE